MIETIISGIISSVISAEYLPLVVLILAFLVGFEQWLAKTNRIRANSTLELIVGIANKIVGKNAPQLQHVPQADPAKSDNPDPTGISPK